MVKTITPIALEEEDYEDLRSLKYELQCKTWKDLLLKLKEFYDEKCDINNRSRLRKGEPLNPGPSLDDIDRLNEEISKLREDVDGIKYPLNSRDFEVLIDHAKKCDSDVCEIRDVWDKEVEEVKKETKKPYAVVEGEKKEEEPSEVKKEKKSNPNKEWSMWDRLSEEEEEEKPSNPNEEE